MRITIVAGARPNFMKIAPLIHELDRAIKNGHTFSYRIIHTGQHYDRNLSETFFEELDIPAPHVNLGVGSGTQAEQTAGIMVRFEWELIDHPTDLVIVVGDVTSTMACSITAKKLNTKVAHIEAGIRSFDLTMPEEINRMVTDSITDYFFTTSHFANENLHKAGIPDERIFFVGNVMIDTLLNNMPRLKKPDFFDSLGLQAQRYITLTLHRPVNVDDPGRLVEILNSIVGSVIGFPVVFPVHPRTAKTMRTISQQQSNLFIVDPLGYLEFNYLVRHSYAVITDSGGITEETTVMGVPCMTLRDSTERPETCTVGTNELIGTNPANIVPALRRLFNGQWKKGGIPELWDGRAAERIVKVLLRELR
jgi:UDP-N-acetylglucosamine 2-epimerase (non-hydrolysing)